MTRRLAVPALVLWSLLPALPARAHLGPPFPILTDRRLGPYVASVWTDPDIGTGTFYVVFEGRHPPAGTRVRIGVRPLSASRAETLHQAAPQPVRSGASYFAAIPLDRGGMWRVRVLLDGREGRGTLSAEVEATPDGTIGPIGLVVYALPFLAVGFLWLKAVVRRRQPAIPAAPRQPLS